MFLSLDPEATVPSATRADNIADLIEKLETALKGA
jgi:hypothetical protein